VSFILSKKQHIESSSKSKGDTSVTSLVRGNEIAIGMTATA